MSGLRPRSRMRHALRSSNEMAPREAVSARGVSHYFRNQVSVDVFSAFTSTLSRTDEALWRCRVGLLTTRFAHYLTRGPRSSGARQSPGISIPQYPLGCFWRPCRHGCQDLPSLRFPSVLHTSSNSARSRAPFLQLQNFPARVLAGLSPYFFVFALLPPIDPKRPFFLIAGPATNLLQLQNFPAACSHDIFICQNILPESNFHALAVGTPRPSSTAVRKRPPGRWKQAFGWHPRDRPVARGRRVRWSHRY